MTKWTKDSWKNFLVQQERFYPDQARFKNKIQQLETFPPIVFADELAQLKKHIHDAANSANRFIIQGGPCAETFDNFSAKSIRNIYDILLIMQAVFATENVEATLIGRIAGQYAKPRSSGVEIAEDGHKYPSYFGDMYNGYQYHEREIDPQRMIWAYYNSAATMNLLRAYSLGGYADSHRILDFTQNLKVDHTRKRFASLVQKNHFALIKQQLLFTSHEALNLDYESALTRKDSRPGSDQWVGGSGHMLWVGDRTRDPNCAHIEYLSGVANPVGVKCGPTMTPEDLVKIIKKLNPKNEEGKLVLISRMGAGLVEYHLPKLVEVTEEYNVAWFCDPMHGNTVTSSSGKKTRNYTQIVSEISSFFSILKEAKIHAAGIHLELTGEAVTECTGFGTTEENLNYRYLSRCDPRLNADQAFSIAEVVAKKCKF